MRTSAGIRRLWGISTIQLISPTLQFIGKQLIFESHDQAVVLNVDPNDVIRFLGRAVDPPSLTDGVTVQAIVGPYQIPGRVDDVSRLRANPRRPFVEKRGIAVVMDKAYVLTLLGGRPGANRFRTQMFLPLTWSTFPAGSMPVPAAYWVRRERK
jgi:hypothetical protein